MNGLEIFPHGQASSVTGMKKKLNTRVFLLKEDEIYIHLNHFLNFFDPK